MKKIILFTVLILTYIGIIICWNWLTNGNPSPIGFIFVQLPIFFLFLIALIILDWTVYRRMLGKWTIVVSEIILLFIFFVIFSIKTATVYYEIKDDAKWFVVVYTDKMYNKNIHYSFPLNKVMYIESEELNFISRKQIGFRDIWERSKRERHIPTQSFRFLFNDTVNINHARSFSDNYDFEVYGVGAYIFQDTVLTQSNWNTIREKIDSLIRSETFTTQ